MNPASNFWAQVEDLFYAVVDLDPTERARRLEEAPSDDLRREVASLLDAFERSDDVLKGLDQLVETPSGSTVVAPDRSGTRLAQYEVLEKLGSGGMGVVYRAYDTALDRPVALKFLSTAFGADDAARERLLDEARAASALDHPGIAVVYQVGETPDAEFFLAMAHYEGETLRDKIRGGPLPLEEALRYAVQIARGLAKAHAHGIVHRDVKPSNVIVTTEGTAKIVDFGIAEIRGVDRTRGRAARGTVAYMSPEQLRGEAVDHRADLWALGIVFYEMLSGRSPFSGAQDQALIYAVLHEDPPAIERLRPDVARVLSTALDKDPARRYQSATSMLASLEALQSSDLRSAARLLRKPRVAAAALAGMLLLATGIWLPLRSSMKHDRARALLLDIERLAEAGDFSSAYALAVRAEEALPDDSSLARWWPLVADSLFVTSEPEGARVTLQRFDASGRFPEPEFVGVTPIRGLRIARADYRVRLELPGYAPLERMATREFTPTISIDARLAENVPEEMVYVPGGTYRLVSWSAPTTEGVVLSDFLIDRPEVSNRDYQAFVDAGGYANPAYWKVSREEVERRFVDRTGRPGPRGWRDGRYPEGTEDLPVTGVTWYEAAAFAEFRGKRLPTVFEWEKAARDGAVHPHGIVMPWGLQLPGQTTAHRANFSSRGPVSVDELPFGVSPYGAYNMAGNVKEWCFNQIGEGRATIGGSWEDPEYLFAAFGSFSGFHSTSAIGFRCARSLAPGDQGDRPVPIHAQGPHYEPVDGATYRGFLSHYRYDRGALSARIVETRETAGWKRETIAFSGPGEILAYLYVPRNATPPYQTIVFVDADPAFWGIRSVTADVEEAFAGHITYGRALLAVVPAGGLERPHAPGFRRPDPASVAYREMVTLWASEISRGLDYLETRGDIDHERIAYFATSAAGFKTVFAAVEPRYRAVVLQGAGIRPSFRMMLPEINVVNFAPRLQKPVLLVNGRFDEVEPYETNVRPLYDLLPGPKRLVLVEGGHVPPAPLRVPVINAWLDEVLGDVGETP